MAVNYMDRLATLRGDRSHAAGAPVLHADEKSKRKKKRKLSRKQKAALAKGRAVMAARRGKKRKKSRRGSRPTRVTRGKAAVARRKRALSRPTRVTRGRKAVARRKAERRIEKMSPAKRKAHYLALLGTGRKRKKKRKSKRSAPKRTVMAKKRKKKSHRGGRKSAKRVAAGRKAARTRKRHKAERAAARRRGGHKKRSGHKRRGHGRKRGHKRAHARRAAPRRRKRGGRARKRNRGLMRRANRGRHGGQYVARGGRQHGRRVTRRYHKAGRVVKESYSMENPLDMSELATGLVTGLIGYVAADVADRMIAGRGPLGGTLYAEAAPIYSDYMRLGAGLAMAALPLVGAHFINGAKHRHIRAGLQFFGFGAGIRTLGHLFTDLVSSSLKNNSMVGPTVQALYPHEIVSAAQAGGVAKTGAGALPEHVGNEGLGLIPEGLAACCNNSSRMINPALSVLQPIGRSAEMGGAAAGFAPPPVALPPPIERIVQQPYSPPVDLTRNGGGGRVPAPQMAPVPPPGFTPTPVAPPARSTVATAPGAVSMAAAYPVAPAPVGGPSFVGPSGLPSGPFGWGNNDSPD